MLGEATIKGQRRFIRLEVAKAEAEVIDAFPEGYDQVCFHEVLTTAGWETLCSENPDPKVLRDFGRERTNWFRGRIPNL